MRKLVWLLVLTCCSMSLLADSAAGLRWDPPSGWTAQAAQPMRAATYTIAATAGDKSPAECAVYFFGAGQGGSVQDNLERWKGQFTAPNGKPAPAQVAKKTSHGLPMTTIDTSGDYSGMGGPMAPQRAVPGYRLLGAIVEGPGGNIFIKFTGPIKTVEANRAKFDLLLSSFRPGK